MSETSDLAGLDWSSLFPENLDMEDEKVWESILDSNVGIFQYESDFAHQIYKDLFSKETIYKIRQKHPNFSYMDLFSLGNAILRPSGASYREYVMQGEFYDNGHDVLNKFLAPTLGRLVYQEDIINFLTNFCGYSGGEADVVRRAIGKKQKDVLEKVLPEIKQRFIDTMVSKYDTRNVVAEQISEPFIQVIIDSSDYGFSINHSDAYSALGYTCAWLRYYYPLEFITANLNVNISKEAKTNRLLEYAKSKGIEINPIKFRYSRAGYMFDKETNSIYQGIHPVKFLNAQVAEGLYGLKDRKYKAFVDLLMDIKDGAQSVEIASMTKKTVEYLDEETFETVEDTVYEAEFNETAIDFKEFLARECTKEDLKQLNLAEKHGGVRYNLSDAIAINSKQMKILISLNYFSEFGKNKKLLTLFEAFDNQYNPKHKLKTKKERYAKLLQLESELEDESLSLVEQCTAELEFLGHVETTSEDMPPNIMILVEVDAMKTYTKAKAYQFCTGEIREFKMGSKLYQQVPFEAMDVVQIVSADIKPKNKKIDGRWQAHPTEKEAWLKEIKFIRKGVEVERD